MAPFPLNYRTLVVSIAGHWSLKLFECLAAGYPAVFNLFRLVITDWAYQASLYLEAHTPAGASKEIVVRPYLPADDNCHSKEIQNGGSVDKPQSLRGGSYSWEWIPYLNLVFEEVVKQRDHPHITYFGIERPGSLRPDAQYSRRLYALDGWSGYHRELEAVYLSLHLSLLTNLSEPGVSSRSASSVRAD